MKNLKPCDFRGALKNALKGLAVGTLLLGGAAQSSAATFVGDRTDFRDETIYFAMTTRFYDGDHKNNVCGWDHQSVQIANGDPDWRGDFKGLIDKLDYIKALGFTAIWITPITQNCSGTDFHGYHSMDFSSVDLRYESRKDWGSEKDVKFQDLIDAAHEKGMKIILDIVLNHTSNFGEKGLCELFTRSQDIRNQASVSAAIIPNYDLLPSDYNDLTGTLQYNSRFKYLKNTDGQNHDNHNYWHHLANAWNWDYPSRWWGQIAGDCVDLNTENPTVSQYLVDCYGKFIEMGVDGFRIDTTGHISRLTFNTSFIPQFAALGEKYKSKRLNEAPFFMFGECCARYSDVTYRDQPNLSSYFYTWKSPQASMDAWNYDASYWDTVEILEGNDNTYGNMNTCLDEPSTQPTSDNVFMKNGAWHDPDYSDYSGFSIIDFPMHYNFNNADAAVNIAKSGDKYYNDASYNVVYVDSHDYCPGPNDGTRFNGGTAQWAENLSLMFTFRGIPCIYYGSEVEFKKGQKVDAGGTDNPVKDSGRAYFGNYIEGNISTTDFGEYTADGHAATTLNGDLSQHIIRLNKIRAAVPALRKGQYTFDGCTANGGYAFKRAYKDSYALVAINGGATFTNTPAGTYVDLVTGKSYTGGGSITVDAPKTQGQLRVLVKDWTGGKVGEDGKYIYDSSSVAKGGNPSFDDVALARSEFYTEDDAIGTPQVILSPAGGAFKTETLTVTATLNAAATSGWIQVGSGAKQTLTSGKSLNFTIGSGMNYGESVTVTWGADSYTGSATYKKVDPNAVISVYVTGKDGTVSSISGTNLYSWNSTGALTGEWPGKALSQTATIDGKEFYYHTFDSSDAVNIIFNRNGSQTADITGIDSDTYFEYDGGTSATKIDVTVGPKAPVVKANPASGTKFNDDITVTLTVSPETSIYYTLDGSQASASSTLYTSPIKLTSTTTINTYVKNDVGENRQSFTYTKVEGSIMDEQVVYFDNSSSNWSPVYVYCWDDNHQESNSFSGKWPGQALTETATLSGKTYYVYRFTPEGQLSNPMIIFNNGSGTQTSDLVFENNAIYNANGKVGTNTVVNNFDAVSSLKVFTDGGRLGIYSDDACTVDAVRIDGTVRRLQVEGGYNYYELPAGFYIVAGSKVIVR
jgi:glycosidase